MIQDSNFAITKLWFNCFKPTSEQSARLSMIIDTALFHFSAIKSKQYWFLPVFVPIEESHF